MIHRTSAMLLLVVGTAAAGPEAVRWKTDLDGALAEAKNARRPILVYVLDSV